jgi:hypothetical protein
VFNAYFSSYWPKASGEADAWVLRAEYAKVKAAGVAGLSIVSFTHGLDFEEVGG